MTTNFFEQIKALKEKAKKQEPTKEKDNSGRCSCGSGGFKLRIKKSDLIRTCKWCGEEKII